MYGGIYSIKHECMHAIMHFATGRVWQVAGDRRTTAIIRINHAHTITGSRNHNDAQQFAPTCLSTLTSAENHTSRSGASGSLESD